MIIQLVMKLLGKGGPSAGVLGQLTGLLGSKSALGGLSGLLGVMNQKGMGDIAKSWVSKGQNQPISPDQVKSLLGSDQLADMAGKAGLPADKLAKQLSKTLPGAVDKLTPDGEVPGDDKLQDMLGGLSKLLGR